MHTYFWDTRYTIVKHYTNHAVLLSCSVCVLKMKEEKEGLCTGHMMHSHPLRPKLEHPIRQYYNMSDSFFCSLRVILNDSLELR